MECSRYYAVRCGRTPGIYSTWKECEAQVKGFSRASYKRFSSQEEAQEWMKSRGVDKESSREEVLEVYIDGSHRKGTRSMGYGIFCRYQGQEYAFSQRADPIFLRSFFGGPSFEHVSNPTMELAALAHFLYFLRRSKKRFPFVRIYYDYEGVEKWMTGVWTARKPYIQTLVTFAQRQYAAWKESTTTLEFHSVRSHTGNEGNEKADRLAKGKPVEGALSLAVLLY